MDPVSHGIFGAAISTFSGTPVGFTNPIMIGCTIGAVIPDIDVAVKLFKDDYLYLKHHRGFTHSLPVLAAVSLVIAAVLNALFAFNNIFALFFWTFVGALSHTFFDLLNSYGAKLFKKKRKLNLLTLYDPVILVGALFLVFTKQHNQFELLITLLLTTYYLSLKALNKQLTKKRLVSYFSRDHDITSIRVMPSLKKPFKWDFVVKTNSHSIVGQMTILQGKIDLVSTFKNSDESLYELFESTNLGQYFSNFTPNYHIIPIFNRYDNTLELKVIDLRYYFKNSFMHHATLVVDSDNNIVESIFRPYKYSKIINIAETA